jgi:hypothetical protein
MKRIVTMMIAACAIAAVSHAQSTAPPPPATHWLLRANTISKDVSSLEVEDTGTNFVVLIYGTSFPDGGKPFKPFETTMAHVWLLRHDGTAQRPDKTPPVKVGVGNAGSGQEVLAFSFERSSPQDLAAVAVSVNGEMFVRKIE